MRPHAFGMLQGADGNAFAWIEEIANGYLVYHRVTMKRKTRMLGMHLPGDTWQGDEERVYNYSGVRTVFCKDMDAIVAVLKEAMKAQEEIKKVEEEEGPVSPA